MTNTEKVNKAEVFAMWILFGLIAGILIFAGITLFNGLAMENEREGYCKGMGAEYVDSDNDMKDFCVDGDTVVKRW